MNTKSLLETIDFHIYVYKEMIDENGEDSGFYGFTDKHALMSVFDGCGGLGAKKYNNFQNKTGAYMASRAASGATKTWFETLAMSAPSEQSYKKALDDALAITKRYSDSVSMEIRGSMQKPFPTTLVSALSYFDAGRLLTDFYWAGDSRGYILDEDGLYQITEDDIDGEDAMSNLTNDGVLTNVVHFNGAYTLHKKTVCIKKPSIIFSATDGCFGYMSTPMEFEYMLLDSLIVSRTPDELERLLLERIGKYASDDYTLNLMAVGFDCDYEGIKKQFEMRRFSMYNDYIKKLDGLDYDGKVALWDNYKGGYYGYAKA